MVKKRNKELISKGRFNNLLRQPPFFTILSRMLDNSMIITDLSSLAIGPGT